MAFKLAISNIVAIKIDGRQRDKDGVDSDFSFFLMCDRLTTAEMQSHIQDNAESLPQFFEKIARNWRDQALVLNDDGSPAAYSVEALQALMSINGMPLLCWHSYTQQVGVLAKN
jgi:hypothetical protein